MKDDENDISFGAERFSFGFSFLLTKNLMEKITGSSIGQWIAALLILMLAAMFGIMFIIGSAGLLKSEKRIETVTIEVNEVGVTDDGESSEME